MYKGAATVSYSELHRIRPSEYQLLSLLRELEPVSTVQTLARINAYLRLSMGADATAVRETQRQLIIKFINDESLSQLKKQFARDNIEDHIVFHSHQVLYLISLALRICRGGPDANPWTTPRASFALGECCLMANDLFLRPTEHQQLTTGTPAARDLAAATQLLIPYEIQNPASPRWLLFRSHVIYQHLLGHPAIKKKIADECGRFEFEFEFQKATRIPLSVWLDVVFAIYAYFAEHKSDGHLKNPSFAALDVQTVGTKSNLSEALLNLVMDTLAIDFDNARCQCDIPKVTDDRHDLVIFRASPLIRLPNGLYVCVDVAILLEKIFSGVHWIIHDHLPTERRESLFQAWGVLCEAYVHWLTDHLKKCPERAIYHSPEWSKKSKKDPEIGPPDDCWLQGERLVIVEVKAGFLSRVARTSADAKLLTADINKKIMPGVKQLARKLHRLFSSDVNLRRDLKSIDLSRVKVVLPIIVVQEHCFRSPLWNSYFNSAFQQELKQYQFAPGIAIRPLNLIHLQELERLVASCDYQVDVMNALWFRSWQDPDMVSDLHNFLLDAFGKDGYGAPVLGEFKQIQEEHWEKIRNLIFPLA